MDKKQQRKQKILQLAKSGATPKDFDIFDQITALEDKLDTVVAEIKEQTESAVTKLADPLRGVNMVKIKGPKGDKPTSEELLSLIKPLIPEVPIPKDGNDYVLTDSDKEEIASMALMDLEVPVVEKIIEKTETIKELPQITEIIKEVALAEKPEILRDKLESLKNDERLDISAIRGFEKTTERLTDSIINRAIGIVDQRSSFLIQKVSNLQNQVNGLPTTSGGGGTLSIQQPTSGALGQGTFVWATAPTIIFRDGVAMQKVSADGVTVNWTGTTTTVLATWPNFDIFGI